MSRSWLLKGFLLLPEYIRKIAASIPPDSGIEVVTELPRSLPR